MYASQLRSIFGQYRKDFLSGILSKDDFLINLTNIDLNNIIDDNGSLETLKQLIIKTKQELQS